MIGKLVLDRDGYREAILDDDGVWSSDDAPLAEYLNLCHSTEDASPADGRFGRRQVMEAAHALHGQEVFPDDAADLDDADADAEIVY